MLRIALASLFVGLSCFVNQAASAQAYPSKPVRVLTSTVGGATDFAARIIAQGLNTALGKPVVVDNRAAIIANETASRAPADGYTLLVAGSALWINPLIEKSNYDPLRDFAPVAFTGRSPTVLLAAPSVALNSVKDMVAAAKAQPGKLNFGSGATGGPPHLSVELLKYMAGVNVVRVPYRGGAPALTALLGNEIQLMFATSGSVPAQLIKSDRLKALAVTSLQPSQVFPGLPTMSDSGLPGYEVVSIDAVLAPARTSHAIIERLRQEIARDVSRQEIKQRFLDVGTEVFIAGPEECVSYMKADVAKWSAVLSASGVSVK